jgi:xanthine dehydrogenase YagS FAD-binding subunit
MNRFEYLQPDSLAEAQEILSRDEPGAVAFAGGTDILSLIKEKIVTPERVVNLKKIPGLGEIREVPGEGLDIGAIVPIADIAAHAVIQEKYTVLAEAAAEIASPQLRNVGTLGGNLCQRPRCWYFRGDFHCAKKGGDVCYAFEGQNKYHCIIGGGPCFIVHPSDTAVALLALDAWVDIFSGGEPRRVPIADFYILPEEDETRETVLGQGEIVTGVHIPALPPGVRSGYVKFKERGAWDFAVASVAAAVHEEGGILGGGRVAFGGVAPVPWLDEDVGTKLAGLRATPTSLAEISGEALVDAEPLEMNAYKLPLARSLLQDLLVRFCS